MTFKDNILKRQLSFYNIENDVKYRAASLEKENDKFINGYAAIFNKWSRMLYDWEKKKYFRERLLTGAFSIALKDPDLDVFFFRNHNPDKVISRIKNGSLILLEDNIGLNFDAKISNTSYALDTWELVRTGILTDNSFAFTIDEFEEEESEDKTHYLRTITKVGKLYDVSVVTFGAYTDTSVSARNLPIKEEVKEEVKKEDETYKILHKLRENEINLLK